MGEGEVRIQDSGFRMGRGAWTEWTCLRPWTKWTMDKMGGAMVRPAWLSIVHRLSMLSIGFGGGRPFSPGPR